MDTAPATNLARYKADLDKLVRLGQAMELDLTLRHLAGARTLAADEKKRAEELNGTFDRPSAWWNRSDSAARPRSRDHGQVGRL